MEPHFIKATFTQVLRRHPEHWWRICVAIPAIGRENVKEHHCDVYKQIVTIDKKGWTYLYGKLHSFNEQPAMLLNNAKHWWRHGYRHRDGDLPAVLWDDGGKEWWSNGQHHRDGDRPAMIWPDGSKIWYKNGKHHRDGDKPAGIWTNSHKMWFQNGQLHRENNQPAVISADGYKSWYKNDRLHRENNQPAVLWDDGTKLWFYNGKEQQNPLVFQLSVSLILITGGYLFLRFYV